MEVGAITRGLLNGLRMGCHRAYNQGQLLLARAGMGGLQIKAFPAEDKWLLAAGYSNSRPPSRANKGCPCDTPWKDEGPSAAARLVQSPNLIVN